MRYQSKLSRTGRTAIVASVFVLAVAGCAKKLDATSTQDQIKTKLPAALGGGVVIKDVSCPDMPEAKKGNTFICTISFDNGASMKVKGTLTDDNGTFDVEPEGTPTPAPGSATTTTSASDATTTTSGADATTTTAA